MANESKFAGLFESQSTTTPVAAKSRIEKPAVVPVKVQARAQGKRSHPDYKQFSVLLKKQTHKQAVRALDDLENGQDLSDLMQQLLEQWVAKQSQKTQ
jgi:hypothetical protein